MRLYSTVQISPKGDNKCKNKPPSQSVNGTTGEIGRLHLFDTHLLKANH